MPKAVIVPPPSRATDDGEMSEAGIAGWLIALIAVACVLFILVLLFREGRSVGWLTHRSVISEIPCAITYQS